MSSDVVVRCLSVHQRKKELPCFLTASVSVGKLSLANGIAGVVEEIVFGEQTA